MSSAYFAPLVTKTDVITSPGQYITRCGETVTITATSRRHDFGCVGTYADGIAERWHKSGRISASRETRNDIVKAA
jgi:hypothetical protein